MTREEEKTLRAVYEFATEFECDTNAYIENDLFSIKNKKCIFSSFVPVMSSGE